MSAELGPVRQIAFVVKDIEKAMAQWVAMGIGPWYYGEHVPMEYFLYRNASSDMQMSVALANSGFVQIELIQQRNDAPSMYRDFLETVGEGMHHIAYWTDRFDEQSKLFLDKGYTAGQSGNVGENGRFVYYVSENLPGTVIELSEMSGFKGAFFKAIADAAVNWDGSDPVRRVGK